jgi:hypothetical protein
MMVTISIVSEEHTKGRLFGIQKARSSLATMNISGRPSRSRTPKFHMRLSPCPQFLIEIGFFLDIVIGATVIDQILWTRDSCLPAALRSLAWPRRTLTAGNSPFLPS